MTTEIQAAVTASPVRFGSWRSVPTFRKVTNALFFPFDIRVMNIYDHVVVDTVHCAKWKMMAMSNGGFYLYPDSKVKTVRMRSTNGYSSEVPVEISGLIATVFAASQASFEAGGATAGDLYYKLLGYLDSLPPELADIVAAMID
jgi:hypothetical protein